ncbi:MAG: FadR family transcriptional regulator [Syntrophaceae bacterium]|nr:FadR family transcriptional regulator [Syntrophaceae bacterium]
MTYSNLPPIEKLRKMLAGRRATAGGRLPPERALAESLKVSRAALRKALAVLEREGKIWRHVGRGTFLGPRPESSPEDVSQVSLGTNPAEIMEARLILEPKLAALAALRATQNDLADMELCLKRSRETPSPGGFEKWDEQLHWTIAQSVGNSLLVTLFAVIHKMRRSNIWGDLKEASLTPVRRRVYSQQHKEVLESFQRRDAVRAERLMREHLETVRNHLLETARVI